MTPTQGFINHIALVLDSSSSMSHQADHLIKVADAQIAHLAARSKELDQETRVSVYTFANDAECVIYDKDVLRLPSIRDHYRTGGMTALIDATMKSIDDLGQTAQLYGDHAFLIYVLTDGEENHSRRRAAELARQLGNLPENWTVAALVPDASGKHEAKKAGFPADNIAVWDTSTRRGLTEAGDRIRAATDTFMTNRAGGVRGTRALFSTGADAVNTATVAASGLAPLPHDAYMLVPVPQDTAIREFVQGCGLAYVLGSAYYQLSKTESIQPQKLVAIVEKGSNKVYVGRAARDLVGLPDMEVRVKPEFNPGYTIFVQSTSVNRRLVPGTKLLVLS